MDFFKNWCETAAAGGLEDTIMTFDSQDAAREGLSPHKPVIHFDNRSQNSYIKRETEVPTFCHCLRVVAAHFIVTVLSSVEQVTCPFTHFLLFPKTLQSINHTRLAGPPSVYLK